MSSPTMADMPEREMQEGVSQGAVSNGPTSKSEQRYATDATFSSEQTMDIEESKYAPGVMNRQGDTGTSGEFSLGADLFGSPIKNDWENVAASPSQSVCMDESRHTETKQRPYFHTYDEPFRLNHKLLQPGLYYHGYRGKDKQEPSDIMICSPIHVIAEACDENRKHWGLLLKFVDRWGDWHEWAMPMQLISSRGEELRGLLLSMGVRIYPNGDSLLQAWLRYASGVQRITAATRTGWYKQGSQWAFVFPHEVIGSDTLCFQSEHGVTTDYRCLGTLNGWQAHVATYCKGNPMLLFVLSAAFAGPLLKLIDQDDGGWGIHLQGDSSQGKTTALRIAASVWGSSTFIKSWQATINGLEGIAAALNDTLLVLDEISSCDSYQIGAIVYALGNGVGKQRANRFGAPKDTARWRITWISSGERSLEAHMREANLVAKAGQQVRLLNISATEQSYGIFDNLYEHANGSFFADMLGRACKHHFGHAGIAFIKHLIADRQDLKSLYEKTISSPLFAAPADVGIASRAAKAFALIGMAGELAIEYGIVPWDTGSALQAARMAYRKWYDLNGGGQTEEHQILKTIQAFINKHGDSHFLPLRSEYRPLQTVHERAGFWKENQDGRVYCFFPSALEEIVNGFDKLRIARTLERAGWLVERDKDKRTKKLFLPDGTKKGLYVVQPKEQEEEI